MNTTPLQPPVKLDAPGKGLPFPELMVARVIFGVQCKLSTRQSAVARFTQNRDQLLLLAKPLTPAQFHQPILIRRLRGLEDSSRFWSVAMTLDHLRIVNQGVTQLILQLASGITPEAPVSTAAVKPSTQPSHDIINQFQAGCDHFLTQTAALPSLSSANTWPHPWFGPLSAAQWHFLAGFHMNVHLRQARAIIQSLPRA